MSTLRRRLAPLVIMLVLLVGGGTLGYVWIERWSVLDAFYMTAITLTTVGFGEIRPLSDFGRIFTVALLFFGVGTFAFGVSTSAEYLLTSNLGPRLRWRRTSSMIQRTKNHVIVCGYGRVGRSAVESLRESGHTVVVVERDEQLAEQLRDEGLLVVCGDATKDETLIEAGISKAASLTICGASDADNLFIVLSARALNPSLRIVARSVHPENESKMKRAGADRVVSPYQIGGRHMANVLIRPKVTEFLDVVTLDSGLELWIEELVISDDSPLIGRTVFEADLRRKTGVTLVAMIRGTEGATLLPDESARLKRGDALILLGTRQQLQSVEKLAQEPVA